MKKIIFITLFFLGTLSVFALKNNFKVNIDTIFTGDELITDRFNKEYAIKAENVSEEKNIDAENMIKKATYLLLGKSGKKQESAEEYLKRKEDFYALRYNPTIPKDESSFTGLDQNSQEYKDDVLSGITIPGMFKLMADLEIKYEYFGEIKVINQDSGFMGRITLPNATYIKADENEPIKIKYEKTNLTIYYIFKKLNEEYKLYYLMGETTEEIEEYFETAQKNESNSILSAAAYKSKISKVYNYQKLNEVETDVIKNIYDNNKQKVMIIDTIYDKSIAYTGTGFLLTNNILVTTWSYVEKSLVKGQYLSVHDINNNYYEVEGIITADPNLDVAFIKIKNCNINGIELGDSLSVKTEDPIFTISTKTGLGLTLQSGIVATNKKSFQNLMPLSGSDEGSPLFDQNGKVIGINLATSINSSFSYANHITDLKDAQEKFLKMNADDIEAISFESLKNSYYNLKTKEIIVNNISKKTENKFMKIGSIADELKIPLVKASYDNKILTLRYVNEIPDLISNKQLTNSFTENLINSNYKTILKSKNKEIYENGNYKIVIIYEFNYIIVIMTEK